MKILIIFPLLPKYVIEFLDLLTVRTEHEIYVTANIESANELNYSVLNNKYKVINTDIKKLGPFIYTKSLNKIIKKINPDLIVYDANPRDIGQLISIIKSKFNKRKVYTWSMYHRIGGPILYSSFFYKIIGMISDRNMSYTEIGKVYQIARGVDSNKIDVIGTAIDERKVIEVRNLCSKIEVKTFKKKYNLETKKVILLVMRLSAIKKPYFLIDALKILVEKDKNYTLLHVGSGELLNDIKNYTKSLGLEENTIFLGPIYDEKILAPIFMSSDLFIVPTCIGLSAHHAMCYSLPILTDDSLTRQASEFSILSDYLNCLLYKEDDLESLVGKIEEILDNRVLYNHISENAYKSILFKHNITNKVDNFIKSINENITRST